MERRIDDLISRMTLEEKVSQLGNTSAAIPRLGVPAYNWWNEGLHGVARAGYATVFPQAIGMAATFDESLMHDVADVISTEFRAKYYASLHPDGTADWYRGLTAWSPNINIFRDPRWGRGQETYGEDPYLTSRIGIAFVTGLQGNDPKYIKVVATPKHFAVHSGPESTRHFVNIEVSPHDLQDTYLAGISRHGDRGQGRLRDVRLQRRRRRSRLRKQDVARRIPPQELGLSGLRRVRLRRRRRHFWRTPIQAERGRGRHRGVHRRHGQHLRRLSRPHEHPPRCHCGGGSATGFFPNL